MGYVPQNGRPNPPPAIHLKGQWLKAEGFDIGGSLTPFKLWTAVWC
ncbi:SymE family type I addiction module toxin [Xenorhabdus anantnagensis]